MSQLPNSARFTRHPDGIIRVSLLCVVKRSMHKTQPLTLKINRNVKQKENKQKQLHAVKNSN